MNRSGDGGNGVPNGGTGGAGTDPDTDPRSIASDGLPDPSDPDYARKASSLVHKQLQDQLSRGEVDRELLQEMGYTENDLRQFAERLEQRLNQTPAESAADAARQRQFEAILDRIDRSAQSQAIQGNDGPREAAEGFAAPPRPAPRGYRRLQEEYERRVLQQR